MPFGSLDDIPFESLAPQAVRCREVSGVWIVWLAAAGARHQHARRVVDDTCCRNVAELLQPLYRILQLILGPQIARFDVGLRQVAEFHQIVLLQGERQCYFSNCKSVSHGRGNAFAKVVTSIRTGAQQSGSKSHDLGRMLPVAVSACANFLPKSQTVY